MAALSSVLSIELNTTKKAPRTTMNKHLITRIGRFAVATAVATALIVSIFSSGASATTISAGVSVKGLVIVTVDQGDLCCGTWP